MENKGLLISVVRSSRLSGTPNTELCPRFHQFAVPPIPCESGTECHKPEGAATYNGSVDNDQGCAPQVCLCLSLSQISFSLTPHFVGMMSVFSIDSIRHDPLRSRPNSMQLTRFPWEY